MLATECVGRQSVSGDKERRATESVGRLKASGDKDHH